MRGLVLVAVPDETRRRLLEALLAEALAPDEECELRRRNKRSVRKARWYKVPNPKRWPTGISASTASSKSRISSFIPQRATPRGPMTLRLEGCLATPDGEADT